MPFRFKMIGTSSTDDARVRYPHFKKSHFFLQYEIIHRNATRLYFCLYVTAVVKDEHTSNDSNYSVQSDSSFSVT